MSRVFARAVVVLALLFATSPFAQNTAPDKPDGSVALVKLGQPIYPAIARTAHILGDVVVSVGVRQDGTIASADVVSGPPLLQRAALDSAKQSQFECRKCSAEVTAYRITYSFQFDESVPCCLPVEPAPRVVQSENHVTLLASPVCICDPTGSPTVKVRSVKCLWLWKCKTLKYE